MVEGEGFEPSKAEPSDLQSDPFDRSGTPPNGTDNYEGIETISQFQIDLFSRFLGDGIIKYIDFKTRKYLPIPPIRKEL